MKHWKLSIMLCMLMGACSAHKAEVVTIDTQQAKAMMENETVVIVDVRTKAEYDEGHIPHAINVPLDEIAKIDTYADKEDTLLIYCRSGNRSAQASVKLVENGYTKVYDFGGIIDWNGEIEK